jgi:carbonic anhydrase
MRTLTKELQDNISPKDALQLLRDGNNRFVNNLKINRNLLQQVNDTSDGQHPFAAILSCIDSRTSAELIFDQGLGDIFSIRIAGNILNEDIIGSMEFAAKVVGVKILVVLGHTKCGAVKGACDDVELGHLTQLLHKIQAAVHRTDRPETLPSNGYAFVDSVARTNVKMVAHQIPELSPILRDLLTEGRIAIVGGMYNVETGVVEFYENL